MIGRREAESIKGVAILMVLIGHGFSNFGKADYKCLSWGGAMGVCIFLILSGYGLTESYKKNGIDFKFFLRRIKKVLVPFWIVMICESLLDYLCLNRRLEIKDWILAVLGYVDYYRPCIDTTMWYITYLVICYCVFFLIFSLKIPDYLKVLLFAGINIIGYACHLYMNPDWQINYFAFLLGIFLSYAGKYFNRQTLLLINNVAVAVFFIVSIATLPLSGFDVWSIYGLAGAVWAITFIKLFGKDIKIFAGIGKVSYYIYLVEGAILYKYLLLPEGVGSGFRIGIFIILSVGCGWLLYKVFHAGEHMVRIIGKGEKKVEL